MNEKKARKTHLHRNLHRDYIPGGEGGLCGTLAYIRGDGNIHKCYIPIMQCLIDEDRQQIR